MAVHLQRAIDHLKKKTLALASVVEQNFELAIKAVQERNNEYAEQVIRNDVEIDELEVDLEEDCLKILALHQPVASDLRFIVSVLKLNSDLERIGDLCQNIAERAMHLSSNNWIDIPELIPTMADKVRLMVVRTLDALMNQDVRLAQEVRMSDNEVDGLHRSIYRYVEDAVKAQPDRTASILCILAIGRYLERIADHATNIAEDVVYIAEGRIVRHRQPTAAGPR